MILSEAFSKFRVLGWFVPGFLLWAAFPPMAECADALFALAPLMWLSRQGDRRVSAKRWFQSGVFFWVATLSWFPAIVKNNGPWPLVALGWAGLAAYCALFFAAYGWLSAAYWRWVRGRGAWSRYCGILFVEPVLWAGLELVRSRFLGGFAWNQLGVVPANAGFGAPAALGGVYLLSAVVLLVNGTVAGIAERLVATVLAHQRRPHDAAALARSRSFETLVVFLILWTLYRLAPAPTSAQKAEFLRVALVQRNFPCCFSRSAGEPRQAYGALFRNVASLSPELLVLSESALAEFGAIGSVRAADFAAWASGETGGAAVLAGGSREEMGRSYNSAALYERPPAAATGVLSNPQVYDKVHLVPFGEFIPLDKRFPALQKLAPVGSCTPGEPKLLTCGDVPLGVAICFEDTDSALVRTFASLGARALVFITNDSWFSHSNEAVQHAWQAVVRAIETGLPVLRVGNSGVSGTVTPTGRASWLPGTDGGPLVDASGTMFDRVALAPVLKVSARRTPYVRYGDAPLAAAFALLLVCGFVRWLFAAFKTAVRPRVIGEDLL